MIPDEHVLARVDDVLDLSWLADEVADLYADGFGRPGIDPEVAVRLMLAGFLLGIVHDRRLMRDAAVNLAIRWFAGFGMSEALPDHSSLTRIRQRWGSERFRTIFVRVVRDCQSAGIVSGDVVHMDATLIRADVSLGSLAARHMDAVDQANLDDEDRLSCRTGKFKKLCVTKSQDRAPMLRWRQARPGGSFCPLTSNIRRSMSSASGRHRFEADAGRRDHCGYRSGHW